jgi:transposase
MTSPGRYPKELREGAVRMVLEHRGERPSEWAAITSIATKLHVHLERVRPWARREQIDSGERAGVTTEERVRLRQLERESREPRRTVHGARVRTPHPRKHPLIIAQLGPSSSRDQRGRRRCS